MTATIKLMQWLRDIMIINNHHLLLMMPSQIQCLKDYWNGNADIPKLKYSCRLHWHEQASGSGPGTQAPGCIGLGIMAQAMLEHWESFPSEELLLKHKQIKSDWQCLILMHTMLQRHKAIQDVTMPSIFLWQRSSKPNVCSSSSMRKMGFTLTFGVGMI
jgi:hypothetical protein